MRSAIVSLVFVACASVSSTHAQFCNPAVVSVIVRDPDGNVLSETE
jgi:hypothetical protein